MVRGGTSERPRPPHLGTAGAGSNACVIDDAGEAVCLGFATKGQAGIGTRYETDSPAAVTTDGVLGGKQVTGIASGEVHTCAVTTPGTAFCWGNSSRGQVGTGATNRPVFDPTPVDASGVLSGKTIVAVTAGQQHSCALASNGRAYCWGRGDKGQLGNGSTSDATRPVAVDATGALSGKTLVAIDAGTQSSALLAAYGASRVCFSTLDDVE